MGFRQVVINKPTRLSTKLNNLIIEQDIEISLPIEDIEVVLLENSRITLSSSCLRKLAENGVAVIVSDEKHLPVGFFSTFQSHSRQLRRLQEQIAMSEPFKKRIWQKIIIQKILNQSAVVKSTESTLEAALIDSYSKKVDSGDTKNIEGIVARRYFNLLWGDEFTRSEENGVNACLNYGYAIMRSKIANTLAMYGFIPSLGVKHKNEFNNFNLADDFIEPYRPIVDLWVKKNINEESELDKDIKAKLIDLLNYKVIIGVGRYTVSRAIDFTISSFVTAISENDYTLLKLPKL